MIYSSQGVIKKLGWQYFEHFCPPFVEKFDKFKFAAIEFSPLHYLTLKPRGWKFYWPHYLNFSNIYSYILKGGLHRRGDIPISDLTKMLMYLDKTAADFVSSTLVFFIYLKMLIYINTFILSISALWKNCLFQNIFAVRSISDHAKFRDKIFPIMWHPIHWPCEQFFLEIFDLPMWTELLNKASVVIWTFG